MKRLVKKIVVLKTKCRKTTCEETSNRKDSYLFLRSLDPNSLEKSGMNDEGSTLVRLVDNIYRLKVVYGSTEGLYYKVLLALCSAAMKSSCQ